MYQHVKDMLSKCGELMIKTADGEEFELHLHNITFEDKTKLITVDAGDKTYWLDGQQIIYTWIHRVKS